MNKKKNLKKSTMKEVASRAGVTIGTVSHVINGTAVITNKTKSNVLKAIKELNYKPNAMARGLRRSESKMIGLLIPDMTNEYYSRIIRIFTDLAYAEGYTVMLCSFQYNLEQERLELDVLVDKGVDAIVLIGGSDGDEKFLKEIDDWGIPIVLGDRNTKNKSYASVEFDNKLMVKTVVGYLAKKGYTKIGFVTEALTEAMTNLTDRYNGYIEGMKENDLEINERCIFIEDSLQLNKMSNGYDLMEQVLKERVRSEMPEVFIASSDLLAIGMIEALRKGGYKVPDDFGVVGYDDLSISAYFNPALTTIRQDPNKISNAIWDMIINSLRNEVNDKQHIYIKQELIVRKSV